jgi:hypothetical protein
MVKKYLPVTKPIARWGEQNACPVQALFIGLASDACGYGRYSEVHALPTASLAAPADGRYKPPHPETRNLW